MNYVKIMPQDVKNQFLTIARQLDTLTDQLSRFPPNHDTLIGEIIILRAQRDQIARTYPWKPQ